MAYNYFANYGRRIGYLGVDWTFPRTPTIAVISGGAGWFAHRVGVAYGPELIRKFANLGFWSSILIIPEVQPYVPVALSVGATLTTSLTLNIIAQVFFGIKANREATHPLNQILSSMGIDPECGKITSEQEVEPLPKSALLPVASLPEKMKKNKTSQRPPSLPQNKRHKIAPKYIHPIHVSNDQTLPQISKQPREIKKKNPKNVVKNVDVDDHNFFGSDPLEKTLFFGNFCC